MGRAQPAQPTMKLRSRRSSRRVRLDGSITHRTQRLRQAAHYTGPSSASSVLVSKGEDELMFQVTTLLTSYRSSAHTMFLAAAITTSGSRNPRNPLFRISPNTFERHTPTCMQESRKANSLTWTPSPVQRRRTIPAAGLLQRRWGSR